MDEKILPCAFCSSKAVDIAVTRVDEENAWWNGECYDCGCMMPPAYSAQDALTAWNTRK